MGLFCQWNVFYYIGNTKQDHNLGEIRNGKMIFSDFGKIVNKEWIKSFQIRNELFCDEYIIMPNHLHAIVILEKSIPNSNDTDDTDDSHVETYGRVSLQSCNQSANALKLIRKPKSISSFIAGYKSSINLKIDDFIDENDLKISKYNRHNHFFKRITTIILFEIINPIEK